MPDPRDMTRVEPHGFAEIVTLVVCECGEQFTSDVDSATALGAWRDHAEQADP